MFWWWGGDTLLLLFYFFCLCSALSINTVRNLTRAWHYPKRVQLCGFRRTCALSGGPFPPWILLVGQIARFFPILPSFPRPQRLYQEKCSRRNPSIVWVQGDVSPELQLPLTCQSALRLISLPGLHTVLFPGSSSCRPLDWHSSTDSLSPGGLPGHPMSVHPGEYKSEWGSTGIKILSA